MEKWLKQKERMLTVIEEAVNVDPKVIAGQIFQIEVSFFLFIKRETFVYINFTDRRVKFQLD